MTVCVVGDGDAPRTVVAVGDSHVLHWVTPLTAIAEDEGWRLVSIFRGGCNLSTESEFIQEVHRTTSRASPGGPGSPTKSSGWTPTW